MAGATNIRPHMEVVGSCGNRLGTVDQVQGDSIKLTKSSSRDGEHHMIPMSWVASVGESVRLSRDCDAARREWQTA